MSSRNHVSVTTTRSTGLIERVADNSSSFDKSDRAFNKRIFGERFSLHDHRSNDMDLQLS